MLGTETKKPVLIFITTGNSGKIGQPMPLLFELFLFRDLASLKLFRDFPQCWAENGYLNGKLNKASKAVNSKFSNGQKPEILFEPPNATYEDTTRSQEKIFIRLHASGSNESLELSPVAQTQLP